MAMLSSIKPSQSIKLDHFNVDDDGNVMASSICVEGDLIVAGDVIIAGKVHQGIKIKLSDRAKLFECMKIFTRNNLLEKIHYFISGESTIIVRETDAEQFKGLIVEALL